MKDTFTIRETPQVFIWWTNAYGEAHQQIFTDQTADKVLFDRAKMLWHPVHRANGGDLVGWVKFAIRSTDTDATEVAAVPIGAEYHTIERKVDNGWEQTRRPFLTEEITPELEQYYQAMTTAIRLKWPQHTKKKPGRRKMDCNAWAEEQARQGRTVADIFDEWRRRYTEETGEAEYQKVDDPRRYLTEVMSRVRRVKK